MPDNFQSYQAGLESPASDAFAVTPADADLAVFTRGIYVGTTGNVRVTTVAGTDVVFVGVPAGSVLPVRAKRIWSTNTTASNIVGLV